MVIDLIVTETNDGYTGEVPSIKGCESWAHDEDTAIKNTVDLVRFYLTIPDDTEIIVDRARKYSKRIVYKLIFNKDVS